MPPVDVGLSSAAPNLFASQGCQMLAVNRGSVTWLTASSSDRFYVAPKAGGRLVEVPRPASSVGGLAVDEEHIYWTATAFGRVRQVRLDDHRWGGLAARRPSALPTAIAVDDTDVYWVDEGQARLGGATSHAVSARGAVMKVPKRGGAVVEIARDLGRPGLLTIDDGSVYWADDGPGRGRRIRRAPKGGGAVTTLVEVSDPTALAVDEGHVYWTEGDVVRRVGVAGVDPAPVLQVPKAQHALANIAVYRDFVFVTDKGGSLFRGPKAGGQAVRLGWFVDVNASVSDKRDLWVCGGDGVFRFSNPVGSLAPHTTTLEVDASLVAFRADGHGILSAGSDGVRALSATSGALESRYLEERFARAPSTVIAFSSDRRSAFMDGPDGAVERWDLQTGKLAWSAEAAPGVERRIGEYLGARLVSMTPAGDRLLVGYFVPTRTTAKDLMIVLDTATGARVGQIETDNVSSVALLPTGRAVVTGSFGRDAALRVWDPSTGEQVGRFEGSPEVVSAIAVSRDGAMLLTSSLDLGLGVWDVPRRGLLRRMAPDDATRAIALLGDGERAAVSSDAKVCIWSTITGEQLSCVVGGGGMSLAVAPSQREVAWPTGPVRSRFLRIWRIPH